MFCPKCGSQNEDGAKFCSKCGEPLSGRAQAAPPQPAPVATPKKRRRLKVAVIAIVTALVVGGGAFAAFRFWQNRDFNGTVTLKSSTDESSCVIKGDSISLRYSNGNQTSDYVATIAERSQTDSEYVFKLENLKTLSEGGSLDSGGQYTFYIPKNLGNQELKGCLGMTCFRAGTDDEPPFFSTPFIPSVFFKFGEGGSGSNYAIFSNEFESLDAAAEANPASDSFDEDYALSLPGAQKVDFTWSKQDDGVYVDYGDGTGVDITVTD